MSKERIKPEGITGDGLSGMPSRSQLAQARELERLRHTGYKWATQEWYNAKAEQQAVDGQVLCGDCGKPESKRIKYGTPRLLTVDENHERLICSKCDSKIRSQKARERMAKAQAAEPEADTDLSRRNEFWKTNREQLKAQDPKRFANLYNRSEAIADLCASMSLYTFYWPLHGPFYPALGVKSADELPELLDEADLRATINQVVHELRTRGSFNALNGTINVAGSPISMPGAEKDEDYEQFGFITRVPEWWPYDNDGSCETVGAKRFIHKFALELEAELYPTRMFKKKCDTYGCPHFYLYDLSVVQSAQWWCDSCRAKKAAEKHVRAPAPAPRPELYAGGVTGYLTSELPDWLKHAR